MDLFSIASLRARTGMDDVSYVEFLRQPSMSAGLYRLRAGATDPQQPHEQDELYYVVSGEADVDIAGQVQKVEPGSILFVAAGAPHHFRKISEDLELLVVFAPAESA